MKKQINVMLIDDNKIDIYINNQFISQMNIATSITEFTFAADALKFLKDSDVSTWPNLIICDIHMPIMDGFKFISEYKLLPEELKENCRIVMMSSTLNEMDRKQAIENPMVLALLEKPIDIIKLKHLLETEKLI
jgi:CheY-like chemotaxis protein